MRMTLYAALALLGRMIFKHTAPQNQFIEPFGVILARSFASMPRIAARNRSLALHAQLIQCFTHLYRIADPEQDQMMPVTLVLAVVPPGQFSMPTLGQFSVQINTRWFILTAKTVQLKSRE